MDFPVTPAIRFLRQHKVPFEARLFEYVEKGGTEHSARVLGVDEHSVIKTLIFETNTGKGIVVLMHGDKQVSEKNLARHLSVKSVSAASAEKALKLTGYLFGGTSPFGLKTTLPVYTESSIFDLEKIYINGGKRGFLLEIDPDVLRRTLQVEEVSVGY